MSEQRYGVHNCPNGFYYLRDVTDHSVYIHRNYGYLYSPYKEDIELVSTLLNELADKVDEQQATINLLLDLLYQSEAIVISEYSSHIGEDMDKLDKIFNEKDIKEIERFVRGCDDE